MTAVGLAQIWKGSGGTYPVAKLGTRETFIQAGSYARGLVMVPGNWPSLNL